MRIACIHVPQFALQCATRLDPSLRGAPIAVVSGVEPGRERAGILHAPVVLACSRAAWAHGVRLGMTATAARGQSPDIAIVTADGSAERETVRAIADAVLAISPTVDVGGRVGAGGAHLAMYAEVPAKTRGTSFGDRLVELLADLGVAARIGIADDRFTAWVAAAYGAHAAGVEQGPVDPRRRTQTAGVEQGPVDPRRRTQNRKPAQPTHADAHEHHDGAVINVPRGGSAAFLAPRPLSLLAIPSEVQHMLEALGIRTLGEFASLPAPSVARPLEADYQGLARGESGATLRPYHPEAPIREELVVSSGTVLELAGSVSGSAAIAQVSRRIALRLAGRGRGAAKLDVAMLAAPGLTASASTSSAASGSDVAVSSNDNMPLRREVPVTIDGAVLDAEEIARVLAPVLDTATDEIPQLAQRGGWKLRVVVAGEAIATGEAVAVMAEGSSPFMRVERGLFAKAHADDATGALTMPGTAAGELAIASVSSNGARAQPASGARSLSAKDARSQSAAAFGSRTNEAQDWRSPQGSQGGMASDTARRDVPPMPPGSLWSRTQDVANRDDSARRADSVDREVSGHGDADRMRAFGAANDSYESCASEPSMLDPLAVVLSSSGSLFALAAPTSANDRRDAHRRTRRGKQRRSRPTPQVQPRLFDRSSHK